MPTSKPDSPKAAVRVIKKYPNRRLYDTSASAYITLADIKKLVMASQPFVVRDAKSDEDLTRSILLQIILEEEAGGTPIFSEAALANIIRFYGQAMQGFMGSLMEENVQSLLNFQTQMTEQAKVSTPETWAQFMSLQSPVMQQLAGAYMEQSRSAFAKVQEQMQNQTAKMWGVFGLK